MLETLEPLRRKRDMRLILRDGQDRAQHDMIAASGEPHDLPGSGEVLRQIPDWQILDQHAEQPLVQAVCQIEFLPAPNRAEPSFGDEAQHRLATSRRLVKRTLPALAGRNATLRIEIEENLVFPAVTR